MWERMRKIIYDKELKWKLSPSNDEYFDQVGKKMGSCLIKL
jgi:N-acyl-L-homoserine lactone synthetase